MKKHFKLKKPCDNCPFRKENGVILNPGRLESIAQGLIDDDMSTFQCHKTVHNKKGGDWDDEGNYTPSGNESMCFGVMVYLHKKRRPSVGMRIGLATGMYSLKDIEAEKIHIIDDVSEAITY